MNDIIDQKQIGAMAELAETMEKAAKSMADADNYEHVFKKPWEHDGRTYDRLTFDWTRLTGGDTLAIETELRQRGVTLVAPAFEIGYLAAMAARACLERTDEDGRVVIRTKDINALPMPDFLAITSQARYYLLREGF